MRIPNKIVRAIQANKHLRPAPRTNKRDSYYLSRAAFVNPLKFVPTLLNYVTEKDARPQAKEMVVCIKTQKRVLI
jgi:hypothetical protein